MAVNWLVGMLLYIFERINQFLHIAPLVYKHIVYMIVNRKKRTNTHFSSFKSQHVHKQWW